VGAVAGVMLPKTERIDGVLTVANAGTRAAVFPMIESATGLNNVQTIARAPGVHRLVFGSIDFQLDMGITGDDTELLPYRSQIVLASRLARLVAPVDGVTTAIDDTTSLRTDSLRSRRLGFGGKLCIHPRQVDLVNACFGSSDEELAWAHRVLAASGESGGDAVMVDGKMVDRPIVIRAQAIIQEAAHALSRSVLRRD